MKATVIGTGYVRLVTGACLSEMGNDALCLDLDAAKLRLLSNGVVPIHEAGLAPLVLRNIGAGPLAFTTEVDQGGQHVTLQCIAVGTSPRYRHPSRRRLVRRHRYRQSCFSTVRRWALRCR